MALSSAAALLFCTDFMLSERGRVVHAAGVAGREGRCLWTHDGRLFHPCPSRGCGAVSKGGVRGCRSRGAAVEGARGHWSAGPDSLSVVAPVAL